MSDAKYLFDGVDLATLGAIDVLDGTDYMTDVQAREAFVEVPGRDGQIEVPVPPTYDARTTSVTVVITGATATEIRRTYVKLHAVVSSTRELTRVWGGLTTKARVRFKSLSKPAQFNPDAHVLVSATFDVPGVFWLGSLVTIAPSVPNGTAQVIDSAVEGMAGAIADLKATFTGPLTLARITDRSYGTWVEWAGTVPTGQTLVIDTAAATATVNGVAANAGLSFHPHGGRVIPVGGTAKLQVLRSGGTGAITITYSPPFF